MNDASDKALNSIIATDPWKSHRQSDLQLKWNNLKVLRQATAKLKQIQKDIKQESVAADNSSDNKIPVNDENQISIYDSFSFI